MDCENNDWTQIYFTQLLTTLGQLSAVILSGAIAVPVASYYSNSLRNFLGKTD